MFEKLSQSTPMVTIKSIIFHLILISSFVFATASPSEICSDSFCSRTQPVIRFPFRLQGLQPNNCGYPGFDLSCDAFNHTLIELTNSGRFSVQAVDYATQQLWLSDPGNCLPRRLLDLNLSGSLFAGLFYQDFTLFNCTFDYKKYKFDPISCLSGENYTVLASSSERAVRYLESKCSVIATVAVPVQWDFFQPVMTSSLSEYIRLTWASPRCALCESGGGRCGFGSVNSTEIVCRNAARRGLPRGARYAVIVGIGVPAFLCLIGFMCFLVRRLKRFGGQPQPIMEFSVVVAPQPTNTVSGLDGSTIESYPKTVLGESRRLPKPDDSICSICLSDYKPKETLRSIPECQHCFHAECIDEWLRLNPSCPVCRNAPKCSPLAKPS